MPPKNSPSRLRTEAFEALLHRLVAFLNAEADRGAGHEDLICALLGAAWGESLELGIDVAVASRILRQAIRRLEGYEGDAEIQPGIH